MSFLLDPRHLIRRQILPAVRLAGRRRLRRSYSDVSTTTPIESILVANRGEIALRVSRTAAKHGIRVTTLYTDVDALARHAGVSDSSFNLDQTGGYLNQEKIISIAQEQKCAAIHPGYGFLSENPQFARRCADNGIVFIGPPSKAIEDMGDKARSKEIMNNAGVPCVPGYHGHAQDRATLANEAEKIGYPVLIKAVRGGGGKGMRIARNAAEFADMLASAKSEAKSSFGNDEMLVEKYVTTPRHIEVQVFADKHGNCLALGERDCSVQRRHQKILEESPAPNLDPVIRRDIWDKARAAALAVGYEGAGTVEFIFDNDTGQFFFMEMNTRLQVEHPVTEMVTGLDLVHWQFLVAEGQPLPMTQQQVEIEIASRGHAIEARIYAEDPSKGFIPDSGFLTHVKLPDETQDVRIDAGFGKGDEITAHYDPMISKLIVRGANREEALRKLAGALEGYEIAGPITNIEFLKKLCASQDFAMGKVETGYIDKHYDDLFGDSRIPDHIFAEAAVASFLQTSSFSTQRSASEWPTTTPVDSWLSPKLDFEHRNFCFSSTEGSDPRNVSVRRVGTSEFLVGTNATQLPGTPVTAWLEQTTSTLHTFFPDMQLTSRTIFPSKHSPRASELTIFSKGRQHRLCIPRAAWLTKALGIKESSNSVLAPMPCRILRVDVKAGDNVLKDQPLLVIESMKMETTIRSPGNGIVQRVVHGEGEICGAGTALVEFEEPNSSTES